MNSSTESQFRPNPAESAREIADLFLPHEVAAAQMRGAGDARDLFPEEAECVALAVSKRIMEFAAGRACARRALSALGIHDFLLLPAKDRQPLWPAGVVGSISHTNRFCAAVAAPRARLAGLGIDTEQADRVGEELWNKICVEQELRWIETLEPVHRSAAAALLFSSKEAFYKCQYPLTGEWLDFHDLQVEVGAFPAETGSFRVTPTRPVSVQPFRAEGESCRFRFHDGLITAAVAFAAVDR